MNAFEYAAVELSPMNVTFKPVVRSNSGMALVMGLVLLLIITLLAVAMMRGTTMQERMSANNQQQTVTFQAAEASIRTIMDEIRGVTAMPPNVTENMMVTAISKGQLSSTLNSYRAGNVVTISTAEQTAADQAPTTSRSATVGGGVTAVARLYFVGTTTSLNSSVSNYKAYNFVADAVSQQQNTFAGSHHQQSLSHDGPSPSNVTTTNDPAP